MSLSQNARYCRILPSNLNRHDTLPQDRGTQHLLVFWPNLWLKATAQQQVARFFCPINDKIITTSIVRVKVYDGGEGIECEII